MNNSNHVVIILPHPDTTNKTVFYFVLGKNLFRSIFVFNDWHTYDLV